MTSVFNFEVFFTKAVGMVGGGWCHPGACFQVFGGTQDAQEAIHAIQIGMAVDILR